MNRTLIRNLPVVGAALVLAATSLYPLELDARPRHGEGPRAEWGGQEARLLHVVDDPARTVIVSLLGLERLYRRTGREQEIEAMYADVLKRTQSATVRNFVQLRLARLGAAKSDPAAAEQRLREVLEQNLARAR